MGFCKRLADLPKALDNRNSRNADNRAMRLLYVDLLGMKSRSRSGGVNAARGGQRQLRAVVRAGLSALPDGVDVSGGVQSDAEHFNSSTRPTLRRLARR